ncbi:IS110 family transposase, partial [Patescibacteria group bacterium]|nr:IS110 family transposase [Patescibacteria group bacterium]
HKFNNDHEGIDSFLKYLKNIRMTKKSTLLGLESTGSYHLQVAYLCTVRGYTVNVINPLMVNKQNKISLRRVKTDAHDAALIRYCLMQGMGSPFRDTANSLTLKMLVRERAYLSNLRLQTRLRAEEVSHRESYLNVSIPSVRQDFCEFLDEKIKGLDKLLREYDRDVQKLIQSIPGIGPQTAVTFVSEIGDIMRFSRPDQLVAYVGLDPRVHQSGTSINGKGYISKRGSKLLRTRLFNAASVAVIHPPNLFYDFFQKKRSEGKPYRVALCAVMRKMVHVVHAVWSRGTPFV